MTNKTFDGDVVIIGAGPAGLTAALELLRTTNLRPVIFEQRSSPGGLGSSYPFESGRLDIGGHRFHTNSERIRRFWTSLLPISEDGFCVTKRSSVLNFNGTYFEYPVVPKFSAVLKLGSWTSFKILKDYVLRPRLDVRSMRDFYVSTYGHFLSKLFFEDYTQKVWGRSAVDLPPVWGKERLRGPSSKGREASTFLYPKLGPGQFWEKAAAEVLNLGGVIHYAEVVSSFQSLGDEICLVETDQRSIQPKYVISTLPLATLCRSLNMGDYSLPYRSVVSVNFSLERSSFKWSHGEVPQWIYIHHSGVKVGRIQLYRAWNPHMVPDPSKEFVGLEYFTERGGEIWDLSDEELIARAFHELRILGLFTGAAYENAKVFRLEYAYPCYWGDYDRIHQIQAKIDSTRNLYSIGRQGLHRYINMDQAMMSAMVAVEHIVKGGDKSRLWDDFSEMHIPE